MGQGHIMSTRGLVATETPPVKNVMAIYNIAINNVCLHLCGIAMTQFSN
jgi:hypothetical protein